MKSWPRLPSIRRVSSCSWPVPGLTDKDLKPETEPNNQHAQAQKVSLPCDISGSFFPAADVDTFEFTAKKGEVWCVEVASERLGLPTDPSIVVQQVTGEGDTEKLTDIAELSDIPSPLKVSSNGYSYDGPPYNAGSTDIIGQFEVKQDGKTPPATSRPVRRHPQRSPQPLPADHSQSEARLRPRRLGSAYGAAEW